jgi:hypothetical protein
MPGKVLPEKKPNCERVWLSAQVFVARNVLDGFADTKNVRCGNCWIERNSVPIRKRVSRFDCRARFVGITASYPELVFETDFEPVQQPQIDFLRQVMQCFAMSPEISLPNISGKHLVGR